MRTLLSAVVGLGLVVCNGIGLANAQPDPNVTTYHNAANRSGLYVVPNLTWMRGATAHLEPTFNAPIPNEHVYTQPLYYLPPGAPHGLVLVATMSDTVRAFDAGSGAQIWSASVGTPVPSSALPCGGQNPWGIDGTPVIDETAGAIYFNAEVMINNAPKQKIFGLSLKDGSPLPGWPVDIESALLAKGFTFSTPIQDQRGGLALVNGNLYVAYGGHGGDCGDYHGWVVGLRTSSPGVFAVWQSRGIRAGIWGPGGVTYDGTSLFVATGNTAKGTRVWADGEAVIKLDPNSLTETDFFTPTNWQALDQSDLDLGSSGPTPIDVRYGTQVRQLVLANGKDGNAYLEDRTKLGGIGGQLAVQPVSSAEIKSGAAAFRANHVEYVSFNTNGSTCPSSMQPNVALTTVAVSIKPAPASVKVAWCAALISTGSPIVTTTDGQTAAIVWIAGVEGDGLLHGYGGNDGHVIFAGGGSGNHMSQLERFSTILAGEGRLYIAGSSRLYAFSFTP